GSGTLLICKINPRINRVWIVRSDHPGRILVSTEWIPLTCSCYVDTNYIAYYLHSEHIRRHLAQNASGVGGSLMRVRAATILDLSVPLAPLPEQRRIVAEIEKQFTRLEEARGILQRLQARLNRYEGAL